MIEPRKDVYEADDGYEIQTLVWPVPLDQPLRGRVLVIHGVQSHSGWYHGLGRILANAGYETHFPDRRGSGANQADRGHVSSAGRFIQDAAEQLRTLRCKPEPVELALIGISWGGKIALVTAAKHPELVDRIALICPGLHPRVDVSFKERLQIAWAYFTNRRKTFPIPLNDPALFTDNPVGQSFIAKDPLALRSATAALLASSTFLDRMVRNARPKTTKPILLMLGGHDRIVDNSKTIAFFERIPSSERSLIEYPEGHHTLEFDPDPDRYALDIVKWLDEGTSHLQSNRG